MRNNDKEWENPYRLVTKKMKENIPKFYETDNMKPKDYVVQGIFFVPFRSSFTWYLVEYDEERNEGYGLVAGDEVEWGYFSFDELKEIRAQRLVAFEPMTFTEMKDTELKKQITEAELGRAFSNTIKFKD